jgi:hypothetical protein
LRETRPNCHTILPFRISHLIGWPNILISISMIRRRIMHDRLGQCSEIGRRIWSPDIYVIGNDCAEGHAGDDSTGAFAAVQAWNTCRSITIRSSWIWRKCPGDKASSGGRLALSFRPVSRNLDHWRAAFRSRFGLAAGVELFHRKENVSLEAKSLGRSAKRLTLAVGVTRSDDDSFLNAGPEDCKGLA